MGIVDIQHPGLTAVIDTPQGFAVTPGKDDIDQGSETPAVAAVAGAAFRRGHTVVSTASSEWIPDHVEDGFHMWNAIKDTKYERHWRSFVHIRNSHAAEVMKRRLDREEEDRRILKAAPRYLSVPMELLAGVSDPFNWVPGGVFVRGIKGGISVARSARSIGAAAGASTTAQELTLHGLQSTRELSESATNIGGSVFLGGLIGAVGAKLVKHAEWKRAAAALDRELNGYPAVATGDKRYVLTNSGQRFVALDDGSDVFGNIAPAIAREARLESGSIRLPEGFQTPDGHGVGELHIEAKRGEELRALGHKDVAEFVKSVTSDFNEVYRHDSDSIVLVKREGSATVASVTLKRNDQGGGSHWEVTTGGEFRHSDLEGKELLWSRPRQGDAPPGGKATFDKMPARGRSEPDAGEVARGGNTPGPDPATAGAAARTDDVAGNAVAREGAGSSADPGVSFPHGSRIDETQTARAEGLRHETDTGRGADDATGRERQAADRAAERPKHEEDARRDDGRGAAGGRRLVHEEPVSDTGANLAGAGRESIRRGGESHRGRRGVPAAHGAEEVASARTGPPDGANAKSESEEAAQWAASSHSEAIDGATASPRVPGPNAPGIGVNQINLDGIAWQLRVVVPEPHDMPGRPLFTREATNKNAARQIENLDRLREAHPGSESDADAWVRMSAHAFGGNEVPIPPYGFLREIHDGGAVEALKRLTSGQRASADFGIEQGGAFREAYVSGQMRVTHTGKLMLWAFLSGGRSPVVSDGMFIDAFRGIEAWIEKAVGGHFTKTDLPAYEIWARSAASAGSPGRGAIHSLLGFGRHFLLTMSEQNADGVTHLQNLHNMLSDPNMTGRQIRREFLKFGEGSGVDNKIISLALLVAGHNDVMVLDRVRARALFDDGRFKGQNIDVYFGTASRASRRYGGNGIARMTVGVRGLLLYEMIEQALERHVKDFYGAVGRPQDASVGRYHWETWQVHSGQEVSHGPAGAILAHAKGDESAITKVRAIEGRYGRFSHGARYGLDRTGKPIFVYRVPSGDEHAFTPPAFQAFMDALSDPRLGVIPRGFKVTESGNVPWFERQGVSRPKLEELARQYSDLGPPQNSIADPTKAAEQAALSHPGRAAPSSDAPKAGGDDGNLAAAGVAAAGVAAASMAEPGGEPDDNTIVARATRALRRLSPLERITQSPNGATRGVGARLFDDSRSLKKSFEDVGFDAFAETLIKDWSGGLSRALKGTKAAFIEHWKSAGALDEREFNEAVGRALRNDGEADDPQVARAARLWCAQVFGPITEAAVKAGLLPDDVEPPAAGSYFSRTWSRSKLFAMEREFKDTVANYLSGQVGREARYRSAAETDFNAKAREIADDLFDGITGRSDAGPRSEFAKIRIHGQDCSLHIPDALAAPFLEDNIELIGRRFVRAVGADLELAQKFGTPDMAGALQGVRDGYAKLRAQATDDTERHALSHAEQRDIADLESLRDRIRGTRLEGAIERNYARIVHAAQHLDAVRAAGEVSLPSLSDAIRPAMVEGLSAYMQTVDRLAASLREVTFPPDEAALAGQVATRILEQRLSELSDIDDPYASRTPADAFLQKMTDTGASWNGVRMFADMQKSFAAVMVQDRLLKAVRERADPNGISAHVAAQIEVQFAKYGEEIEGVCVANTPAWDKDDATAAALRAFRAAVNKDTGSFIARGTPAGEAMLALKNFALASYQRLLLRGLDAKAERFVGGLIAMTAMGMFAAWAASPDVASDAERWIGEGFERSGIMAVPLELSDAFEKATGFDLLGPVKTPETGARLLPFNAYPGIRAMLGYVFHPHN